MASLLSMSGRDDTRSAPPCNLAGARRPARQPRSFALGSFQVSKQKRERRSPMSMSVGVLDHYNVSTRNLGDTVRFYEDILGLVNGPRPPFDFPGAWLYSEGHPVLHL